MNRLDMTTEEAQLMQGMLRNYLATLDMEIAHTDHRDFKRMLLERRGKVASLLERCSTLPSDDRPREQEATKSH